MAETVECRNIECGKEFPLPEDCEYGGEAICPHCGAVHDFSFETQYGLICDGLNTRDTL